LNLKRNSKSWNNNIVSQIKLVVNFNNNDANKYFNRDVLDSKKIHVQTLK